MGYTGIGERTALLKASRQLNVNNPSELRQAHKWIMETSRFQNRIDWFISQMIPEDILRDVPHGIRNLLRIMGYMKYIDAQTQASLARIASQGRQVIGWQELRPYEEPIARIASSTEKPSTSHLPDIERLSYETCHPSWFVERLVKAFGRTMALRILRRNLSPVSTYARVNDLIADPRTSTEGLGGSRVENLENVYVLNRGAKGDSRAKLAGSGRLVIQDLGSIMAGLVASPKPGQAVLDICASPGNKTSHLAAQMGNEGEICSVELSSARASQWRREMTRTGCSIAALVQADARKLPLHIEADVALVDPPCSNSGVFARNPASKWRVTPARVKELTTIQRQILEETSGRLTAGGTLVYCTCSILPEENELVVEGFLKKHPEFTLIPQTPILGEPGLRGLVNCQRFYSHLHDCNGYFIAKMRKD